MNINLNSGQFLALYGLLKARTNFENNFENDEYLCEIEVKLENILINLLEGVEESLKSSKYEKWAESENTKINSLKNDLDQIKSSGSSGQIKTQKKKVYKKKVSSQ